MLNIDDCAELTGLSKGHLYKLTSQNVIPFYKPNGCRIYFKREEVIDWLQSNRVKTNTEISKEVSSRIIRGQRNIFFWPYVYCSVLKTVGKNIRKAPHCVPSSLI
ncbi:TPA: helix-turn-helix domain-containing protein [Enterobacter hormaechei]